ncbi:MAG TPA: hypothetical protein EYH28_03400 [Anaerolineaceae bacterium]|nr:hypothetical protein [Anaerolineales bacterium]HIQ08554.1 hypothetical protein [Anaerolineaceae bacterium]
MRKLWILLSMGIISLALALRVATDSYPSQATPGMAIAPECRDFYQKHGGMTFFGPPLEGPIAVADGKIQTFANARFLCTSQGKVYLVPLGAALIPADDPPPAKADPLFAAWVEAHGGLALFGPPRTAIRRNEAQKRWEQHFRYLGVALNDGAAAPTLLPYGQLIWETEKQGAAIPGTSTLTFPAPFYRLFQQIGGMDVLGVPLTGPYLNRRTGDYEMVFTYGVVGLTLNSGYTQALILPIVRDWGNQLGISPDPLTQPVSSPQLRFFHVRDGLGYNLPLPFFAFLENHGGMGVLCGQPITEYRWGKDGQIEQWCTNIGLVWLQQGQPHIGLRPIGVTYKRLVTPQVSSLPGPNPAFTLNIHAPSEVRLDETFPLQVTVTTAQGQPLAGARLILAPIGRQSPETAQTDAQGQATFTLKPQGLDAVGAQIYRVCLWQNGEGVVACQPTQVLVLP